MITLQNLGAVNKNKVTIGSLTLWFSYETIVAYQEEYNSLICRENSWGPTTGKLLNELEPDKKNRIKSDEFEKLLEKVLKKHNLY